MAAIDVTAAQREGVLAGVIQNHANRRVPDLRRKLVRRLACHGSILSGVGASGTPGPVQLDDVTVAIDDDGSVDGAFDRKTEIGI
ncbi:hypothetical protein ABIC10_007181 [Bradyrhizobium sp. S3.2.12]